MDLDLCGRTVCITGGSKGIGLATARAFTLEGARVLICGRRQSALDEAAADILQETGARMETVAADVTDLPAIEHLASEIESRFGHLDILVNNAGTGIYKPFMEVTDEELMHGMAINFFAQFRITQRVVPLMIRAGGGAIVNVSGRTATKTNFPPGSSCTGPAKAAEVRFSADIGSELAQHNIRVNCVIPGVVESPERFSKWEGEALESPIDDDDAGRVRRSLEEGALGRRWGKPEEIADLILYLSSPRSAYINAASVIADGGPLTKSYVTELYQHQDQIQSSLANKG